MAAQTPIVLISGRPQQLAGADTLSPTALPPLSGDASTVAGAMVLTLATVNPNVGTFNGLTVNGKGLVTGALATATLVTTPLAATANTGYGDNSTYFGYATTANGFPVAGTLSGARYGTTGTQRLHAEASGQTLARSWNNATAAWRAFTLLLGSEDFTAKGQLAAGTAANAYAMLSVGTDGQILTASAGSATGLAWTTPTAGTGTGTGTGANALASYIVQTSLNAPVNAQVLASLPTGILKVTNLTGAASTAVAADFPVLNQSTTGTAGNVTGIVAAANGGTGKAGITGILKGNGTAAAAAAVAADFPLLNQNTTGTASNIAGTGIVVAANGGTGTAGITGVLKGNGTAAVSAAVPGDFPVFNQNTTGTAANVTGVVAAANGGTGTSGITGIIRGNGSSAASAAVPGDFPVFNQNTTGTASNITGVLNATSHPAITGDVTGASGSTVLTLPTVNANPGTFNSVTTNAKGQVTAATTVIGEGAVYPIIMELTAFTSTAATALTATLIDGSNFIWYSQLAAPGRTVAWEIVSSCTGALGNAVVIVTALGSVTPVATINGAQSTTTTLSGAAFTGIVPGTQYQLRLYSSTPGIASLKIVRIMIT